MGYIKGTLVEIRSHPQANGEPVCLYLHDVLRLARKELYTIGNERRNSGSFQSAKGDYESLDNGDDQKHDSRLHRYVATDDESEDSSQDERNGMTRHNDMRLLVDDVWRLARCHQLGFKRRVDTIPSAQR
ncbi:hypothetical protein AAP_04380 [Ascosphaera apis ARSEF 7405]|uniref:Uncharacterized protein n=1 Tax=Ascosphaera apis ARSEF 7405 TaxID=392613 RepID=A0A162I6E7_9EURO|nr:hypothetical protein AAP_04380 [Ascosphaera apis ARSEF 7405]